MTQVAEAVAAFIEATNGVKHIDRTALHQLISGVGELSEADIGSLVRTLQPAIRGCDWTRYLIGEGLPLDGLTESEREDLETLHAGGDRSVGGTENDPLMDEFHRRVAGHERWQAAESPLVERLESLVGADAAAVERIAEAVGSTTDAFMTLPKQPGEQLPVRLRLALPDAVQTDDDQSAKLLHGVLRAIGVRGRALPDVILLCGRELGLLFPDEVDPVAGTYAFRQARLLVERHLTASPKDVEGVAWLAELSLRANDREGGVKLARTLWTLTAGYAPSDLTRLVRFSLCHMWDYSEPRFDGRSWDAGLVGHLESEWYDREEPLAHALLRRAFATDQWNADLVQTVVELCVGLTGDDLTDDIMPAAGWVWAARSDGPAGYHYYRAWERAFAAATERGEGDVAILAVPHLIAGAVRGRCNPNYPDWFAALSRHAVTPARRRSVGMVLAGVGKVADRLPAPAKVTLARLSGEFAAEMADTSDESAGEADDVLACLDIVDLQVPTARAKLGEGTWDRLSDNTRHNVCEALGLYHSYQTVPGDSRNYNSFVLGLSNAILCEVDVQFSTALRLRWSIFRDRTYIRLLGEKYQKSLGSLPHLFDILADGHDEAVRRHSATLRRNGIRLDLLVRLKSDIELLARVRNRAAHGEKVGREDANLVFGAWFGRGVLREMFEAIIPPR